MDQISYAQFEAVGICVGRIMAVHEFPEAKKPAYKLEIDFGPEIGIKHSSSQLVAYYTPTDLLGRLVYAVVNFAPKRVGPFTSEVLTLGSYDQFGNVVLATPEREVPLGTRLN